MRPLRAITTIVCILSFSLSMAQPNCHVYKEDKSCYEACLEAGKADQHAQGSKESQEHFLASMELCPDFDYSYFESSVPYAKRGLMNEWIAILNKAVALNPKAHLGWRGWYHFFFMRNYEKAIADIDSLDKLTSFDIGDTGDGLYHLNIMKGLCYKGLGKYDKAIALFETHFSTEDYYQLAYDRLHLGVLYLEINEPSKAINEFLKQIEYNDVSEAYFYMAQGYQKLDNPKKAIEYLNLALEKYDQRIAMYNAYRQLPDEIYRSDIEKQLKILNGQ